MYRVTHYCDIKTCQWLWDSRFTWLLEREICWVLNRPESAACFTAFGAAEPSPTWSGNEPEDFHSKMTHLTSRSNHYSSTNPYPFAHIYPSIHVTFLEINYIVCWKKKTALCIDKKVLGLNLFDNLNIIQDTYIMLYYKKALSNLFFKQWHTKWEEC